MKVAIEGCGHGELDKIYGAMQQLEWQEGIKIDLLICCGDFQAVRNIDDLECMSVPNKYKELGTFYKVRWSARCGAQRGVGHGGAGPGLACCSREVVACYSLCVTRSARCVNARLRAESLAPPEP